MNEIEALTVLSGAPLIGSVKVRQLLHRFGSAMNAIAAGPAAWLELSGFGPKIMDQWNQWFMGDVWKRNLDLVYRDKVTLLPFNSPQYPRQLLEISDHPVLLYVKGSIESIDKKSIAVIGTRNASIYGNEMAEKISRELAEMSYSVVSGLARGVDTKAHCGALNTGRTLAVIGSGLANIYPRENERLAIAIAERGALISEYPMLTPPDRQNFPQRNRIVSGLTLGTLLIEAPMKSGAMITMRIALDQGRQLFAIPGRVDSPNYQGNLSLLKERKAILVENARDIASHFEENPVIQKTEPQHHIPLEQEEKYFLSQLPAEELPIDKIIELTKLPIMKINVLLMTLLLKSAIKEYPGKIYKRLV